MWSLHGSGKDGVSGIGRIKKHERAGSLRNALLAGVVMEGISEELMVEQSSEGNEKVCEKNVSCSGTQQI